ncbi:MAG: hypothetical protein LBS31_09040 [Candidatus Adiutrix sp.]|nr:hypothetical protein [Candidatus Adiutrix sp.]
MYFEKSGPGNAAATISLALEAAEKKKIDHIAVASNSGATAELLAGCGRNVVCVSHAYGFQGKGQNEMTDAARGRLQAAGIRVITATHVLSGVERAVSRRNGGMYPAEIMSDVLRMFGHGLKVCVEIAVMALDGGLIPYGEKIIAIGGTSSGADTALVMTPDHANDIFKTRIHEIICKPY